MGMGMPMMPQHHGRGHPGMMGMGGMPGMGMNMGMPGMGGMHHPDQMMMPADMSGGPAGMGGVPGGGSHRAPNVRRRPPPGGQPQAHREHSKYDMGEAGLPRSSVLAGLGGMGRGMHRVSEWVAYVEEGSPDLVH
jgi:hypothetical protein